MELTFSSWASKDFKYVAIKVSGIPHGAWNENSTT